MQPGTEPPATTGVAEPTGEEADQWLVVIDPEWEPAHEGDQPPGDAVVGAWYLEADGSVGNFRSNHSYVPSSPDSPTDPIDAGLRLAMRGDLAVRDLLATLPGAQLIVGLDEQEQPIVTRAPDGNPSVLVLTALAHAERLTVPAWTQLTAEDLAAALPADGVDVLLNPGAPASMRIGAQEFRDAVRVPPGDRQDAAGGPAAQEHAAAVDADEPLPPPPSFSHHR